MIMLDNTVVNVALPSIQRDLGVGLSELEWIVTGYALTFAALMLIVVTAVPVRRRVPVSVAAGGARWIPIAMVVLLAVLGGMLPIVALIAALLARTLWPPAPKVIAPLGILTATAVSVAGRLSGHGQDWAYGLASQAAILIALAAVVSVHVHWFDQRE